MFSAYLNASSDALLESFNNRAGPLKIAGLMLRLLLTDSATGSKIPIIILPWSPAEHLGTHPEWSFYFPSSPLEKGKGISGTGQWGTEKSKAIPCHVPHPRQELLPIHGSGDHTTSIQALKLAQVPGHKQLKLWHFPAEFTLPAVFAVTPCPLGGNLSKCHWPSVGFLICIACTYFTLLPFKHCQIFENCSVPKL